MLLLCTSPISCSTTPLFTGPFSRLTQLTPSVSTVKLSSLHPAQNDIRIESHRSTQPSTVFTARAHDLISRLTSLHHITSRQSIPDVIVDVHALKGLPARVGPAFIFISSDRVTKIHCRLSVPNDLPLTECADVLHFHYGMVRQA